jgi:hypothetical protein
MSSDAVASQRPPAGLALAGDVTCLSEGWYACVDAELAGVTGFPTCLDALDAYVTPAALTKAALAGLPVPDWRLAADGFEPPCLIERVGPQPGPALLVRARDERDIDLRRLTRSRDDVFCVQQLPRGVEIVEVRIVAGRTDRADLADWARDVHRVFGLPLMTARLARADGRMLFCGVGPLPASALTEREREWLGSCATQP